MKWLALAVGLFCAFPAVLVIRSREHFRALAWMILGCLPFVLDFGNLYIALVSWASWPGFGKGLELSVIDILVGALLLTTGPIKGRVPFLIFGIAYFTAACFATLWASVGLPASFYPWQLFRVMLLYWTIVRALDEPKVALWILQGMAIGLIIQFGTVIVQRFAMGVLQPSGSFVHQNTLGMILHLAGAPCLALALAGQRSILFPLGALSWAATATLIASRGTLLFAAIAITLIMVASLIRARSQWKIFAVSLCVLGAMLMAPIAKSALDRRFNAIPLDDEYDERAAFESAANSIWRDHPFGIGPNMYVVIANSQGYNQTAGVAPTFESLSAHVHNFYLLTGAELGYPGFIAFVLLLLSIIFTALRNSFRLRYDRRGDLLLGCGVGVIALAGQSFYEWTLVTFQVQYVFAIIAGLIGGVSVNAFGRRRTESTDHI